MIIAADLARGSAELGTAASDKEKVTDLEG